MEFDCKMCVHEKVCDLWLQQERQDASCFCLDGCDYFEPTLTQPNEHLTCDGCIALGTSYGPCMNCIRSRLRGDMYRRPPEGDA